MSLTHVSHHGRLAPAAVVGLIIACACALALAFVPGGALAPVCAQAEEQQAAAGSAVDYEANIGLNDFKRLSTGTARKGDGITYGYRFTQDDAQDLAIFAMEDEIVVLIPQEAADAAGFSASDQTQVDALISMLLSLDDEAASGTQPISSIDLTPTVIVGQTSYTSGSRTYEIGVPGEKTDDEGNPKYSYAIISRSDDADSNEGLVTCDIAHLVESSGTNMEAIPTFWDNVRTFLSGIDYRPLWVSLKTSGAALAIVFVLGIIAAYKSMGVKSRWKGLVDSLFTIPMVLPPTVCGFLLLLIFGNSTGFGRWLIAHGIKLVFSWPAAVVAATVVAFPLMYRTARGAFEALDSNMLDAARTLGWSEGRIFRRLMVPLAWPSIAAGTVLAFARAMGEFGATLFVAGNYAGITQTMPIAIYFQWMAGNTDVALFWVAVVIVISFVVILAINLYSSHSQRYRASGALSRREKRALRAAAATAGTKDAEADKGLAEVAIPAEGETPADANAPAKGETPADADAPAEDETPADADIPAEGEKGGEAR